MTCFLAILMVLILSTSFSPSLGARKLTSLYEQPSISLTYHNGPLLEGHLPVSILWYGKFSPSQKSIISDFFLSLHPTRKPENHAGPTSLHHSPARWWETIQNYLKKAGKNGGNVHVVLSNQVVDEGCSIGKSLKRSQIAELAHRVNSKPGGLALVLTADDVAVEGFCMSSCGFHGSDAKKQSPYIWVGNSVSQCPGQCAWPFHQPIYGPQSPPLVAPNGDVGVDGMIINIASLLANTVTNPFGNGYYQGQAGASLEAASACNGVYGKGAYPGYAGELLMDTGSGASYNAKGVNGRKFLLPALFDPSTFQCWTLV